MPVCEYISGKTNRQRRSLKTHQLSMTIRSQRCETKYGGAVVNVIIGTKMKARPPMGFGKGPGSNHLCRRYSWCVCVYVHLCLVGFSVPKCCYLRRTSRSHQTGFLSTTMYTLNTF